MTPFNALLLFLPLPVPVCHHPSPPRPLCRPAPPAASASRQYDLTPMTNHKATVTISLQSWTHRGHPYCAATAVTRGRPRPVQLHGVEVSDSAASSVSGPVRELWLISRCRRISLARSFRLPGSNAALEDVCSFIAAPSSNSPRPSIYLHPTSIRPLSPTQPPSPPPPPPSPSPFVPLTKHHVPGRTGAGRNELQAPFAPRVCAVVH